jgi:hypothetical protein
MLFPLSASVKIVDTRTDLSQPSLVDFARTFRADLVDIFGFVNLPSVVIDTPKGANNTHPTIFLDLETTLNHTLFSGLVTGEGYDFEITKLYTRSWPWDP